MIESEFALLQMMKKPVGTKAVELQHTTLCKGPKALNTVYMIRAFRELVIDMVDAKMFCETDINQAVVATPVVRVDHGLETDSASDNCLQRTLLAVRHYLRIDPAVPLQNTEHDRLAARSATALSADPSATKIRLINLDLSGLKRSVSLAFFHQPDTYFLKDQINAFSRYAGQLARLRSRQIHRKIAKYLTKFLLRDSGTAIIPVYLFHVSSLAPVKMCLTTLDPS